MTSSNHPGSYPADIHCYTAAEFLRRRESTPAVSDVVDHGLLLFEDTRLLSAPRR